MNRRLFSPTLAVLVASCVLVTAAKSHVSAAEVPSPETVSIPVKLSESLSSDHAKEGQPFEFVTTREATVGSVTVPAGTRGHGKVASASPAHLNHAGNLTLEVQSLDLSDGRTIAVTAAPRPASQPSKVQEIATTAAHDAGKLASTATTTSVLAPLALPVQGIVLLGSALHILAGKNVSFPSGTTFSVTERAIQSAPAPDPPDQSAPPA